MIKYKPGTGWYMVGIAPVYEHQSGIRVHQFGMYRVGKNIEEIPWTELSKYRAICAGNSKRAVMAWCHDKIINPPDHEILEAK